MWSVVNVKNKSKLHIYNIARVHLPDKKMKEKRLSKAHRVIRLIAGISLSKVFFTKHKIFAVESLRERPKWASTYQKRSAEVRVAKTMGRRHLPPSVMDWAGICFSAKTAFLEQAHLVVKLAGSQPNGLLLAVHTEAESPVTRYSTVDTLKVALTRAWDEITVFEHSWIISHLT
ncbi:hypothetical protein KIN20_006330, partial [Parelaphostrongylus tenuis]